MTTIESDGGSDGHPWGIVWREAALREVRRLDRRTRERIADAVNRFAATGYGDVKRLVAQDTNYRLRVGDWRILFDRDNDARIIIVQHVLPRGSAYN